ncbi:hypothetical protein [Haloarchaeobius litoreus]|uniref:Oligosaccharide repeat unit polymerase n=1 Tax=Haloarchaeobius litoreus TaxID=755306 RepID=A0ABD6DJA4_9EURY|nr:hypothetical protein [Haloarchaeobius litoreus]
MQSIASTFEDRDIPTQFLVAVVLLFLPLDALLYALDGLPEGSIYSPSALTISFILSLALLCLYPLLRSFVEDGDPLEPAAVVGGVMFLYLPVSAAGLTILKMEPAYPSVVRNVDILLEPMTVALGLMNLGVLCFYLGYYRFPDVSFPGPVIPTWNGWSSKAILLAWAVGAAAYLAIEYGYISRNAFVLLLTTWIYYAPPCLLYLGLQRQSPGWWRPLLAVTLVGNLVLLTVVDFALYSLLQQFFPLLLVYHYAGPGISFRTIPALGAGLFVLFPLELLFGYVQDGKLNTGILEHFVTRMIGTESLTMVIHRVPEEVPYQHGETILLTFYSFIPRVLWEGKPLITMSPRTAYYFAGRTWENGGAQMILPAEFYWNFGALGVIVGMLILGVSLCLIRQWFAARRAQRKVGFVTILFFNIGFFNFVLFEGSVADTYSSLGKELVFAYGFVLLAGGAITGLLSSTVERVVP